MPGPIPFAPPVTLSAVVQTCLRAARVIEYAAPHVPGAHQAAFIGMWSDAVAERNVPQLIGLSEGSSFFAFRHLGEAELDVFQELALKEPVLRARFFDTTQALERSIGVTLPAYLPVVASFDTASLLPHIGMALFLDTAPDALPRSYAGVQIYHLEEGLPERPASNVAPIGRARKRALKAVDHFAFRALNDLAGYQSTCPRAVALASPEVVPLFPGIHWLGKFALMGLWPQDANPKHLEVLAVYDHIPDVVCVGGAAAFDPEYLDAIAETLHPPLIAALTHEDSFIEASGNSLILALNPDQEATAHLEFDPSAETLAAVLRWGKSKTPWNRRQRFENFLHSRMAEVLRTMKSGKESAWRISNDTLLRALPFAAEYLTRVLGDPALDSDFDRKIETLRELVDRMIVRLPMKDLATHQVWAFEALLKASGLIAQP